MQKKRVKQKIISKVSKKKIPLTKPVRIIKKQKKTPELKPKKSNAPNMKTIAEEIKASQIIAQKKPLDNLNFKEEKKKPQQFKNFVKTGIEGIDELIDKGVPKGYSVIIAGGTGSGKTILSLQILNHHAQQGKKCLYMSFEESEEHLTQHMEDFGWNPKKLIKNKKLLIKRFNPYEITRNVDALLMKAKGELLIDIEPILFPKGFTPDIIIVDSLTAIASAFKTKDESYRIYVEQLFRLFENIGATAFLISETEQVPKIFSSAGVEEFLADGVIVLYSLQHGNIRENAIEILKLRGTKHEKKIVAMQITDKGIVVYPDQEVFSVMDSD